MGRAAKYLLVFGVTILLFALATTTLPAQISKADSSFVSDTYIPATVLLYAQDLSGDMEMRCTATAIEKNATGYVFVTAAHCGCEDDKAGHTANAEKTFFFITQDVVGEKKFLKATPIVCGYQHDGDDFFELQVDTKDTFPVVPLGKDAGIMDSVVNVASPIGLGKQVFMGTVSAAKLDRPVVSRAINWTGTTLLQMFGVDGGSSGSSVVCLDQHAICAFVVGDVDGTSVIAMPVSRLIRIRKQFAEGKYKPWKDEEK